MTTTRGGDAAKSFSPSKRAATETAATRPKNALRENTLEVEPRAHADRPRLVRQIRNARAAAALDVQREVRPFVRDVVDEQRRVEAAVQNADPQVDQVVRRQLRIERERVLRVRPADVARERSDVHRAEAGFLIRHLRVAVADVLED